MLYTNNYKLKKPESNDNYNIENENYNMDIIDNGICPFFAAVLDSTNVYRITTGKEITELQDGFSVKVAIPSASIGPVSLIVDDVSAVAIKKVNGSVVTNLKANGVYSLTYYNGNFILASGGGVDSDKVTASESDVLLNKTYIGSDEEVHTGNMPNNGPLNASIGINGTFNIPAGYTSGGKVTQNIVTLTGHQQATQHACWPAGTQGNINPIAFLKPPLGYYYGDTWIKQEMPDLRSENIVSGKSIFGLIGTATIQSLGGYAYAEGSYIIEQTPNTILNENPRIIKTGFMPKFIIMHSKITNTSTHTFYMFGNWKQIYASYSTSSNTPGNENKVKWAEINNDGFTTIPSSFISNTLSRTDQLTSKIVYYYAFG